MSPRVAKTKGPTSNPVIKVLQINMQSIRNKLLELEHACNINKVDIICVSEHWLTGDEIDLFVPQGYVPAGFFCRVKKKHGGACIFVRQGINFEITDMSRFTTEVDCELCSVRLTDLNINIVSLYRAPQGNVSIFFNNFELAVKSIIKKEERIVICGDFNIEFARLESQNSVLFSNLLRSLNLIPTVKTPTRLNACIDNVLVNFSEDLYVLDSIDDQFADHIPSLISIIKNKPIFKSNPDVYGTNKISFRKQTDIQIDNFLEHLTNEKWEIIDEFMSGKCKVELLIDNFFKRFIDLWHFCSPLMSKNKKTNRKKKTELQWYTNELSKERNTMLNFFNVYKSLKSNNSELTQPAYNAYLTCKRSYRKNLTLAKKQACENFIEAAPNKCKAAWDIISQEHSPTNTHDVPLNPELINNYFLNSVTDISNNIPLSGTSISDLLGNIPIPSETFQWVEISSDSVVDVTRKLSNSKSMDFFWLSNNILKKTIHSIKEPLAFIFSRCLESGYFPDILKVSKVIPVYKKGDKNLPQNYRPISIVPVFSKILESLIHLQLSAHFDQFNLLSESQFGFRAGRSTTTAVMKIIDHTLHSFENRESVALSLLDLSKAFDCVPFSSIIEKLKFYGVSNNACKIISSYLTNRKQFVSIKGSCSSVQNVAIGVPQGSVLGPFFFSVIINDLPKNLNVESVVYADDTSLFCSNRNLVDLHSNIDQAHSKALSWFSSNKLLCNQDKTQNILLSLSLKQDLQSVKLLGISIDSKLCWSTHVNNLCARLSRVSYLFWKLKDFISPNYLRTAYFGLFQSHISYGLILWGHASYVSDVLLIQKRVIRTVCRAEYREHCKPLFIQFKILTIFNLYILHILIFTKTNLHTFSNRLDIHTHNTRNRLMLDLPSHRLTKTGSSHQVNAIKFFNKLHVSAHSTPLNNFKNKMLLWLQANPFYSLQEFLNSDVNIVF